MNQVAPVSPSACYTNNKQGANTLEVSSHGKQGSSFSSRAVCMDEVGTWVRLLLFATTTTITVVSKI